MSDVNFDLGVQDTNGHVDAIHRYPVGELLEKQARSQPNATAIVDGEGAERTYGELNDRVNRLSNALLDRGVDVGSRIAIVSENRPEFAEVLFAAAKIGAIVATINYRQERAELLHCLEMAEPDVVAISERFGEKREWIEAENSGIVTVGLDGQEGTLPYETLVEDAQASRPDPSRPVSREDALAILYTSGTTGLPKGAVLAHDTLLYRAVVWHLVPKAGPDFVAWGPMYNMISTEPLLTVTLLGGTFYVVDGFKTELVLERHKEATAGYFIFIPGVVDRILEYADESGIETEAYDSVRTIGALADLVDPDKIQRLTELFDAEYVNTFGSTEAGFPPLSNNTIPVGMRPTSEDLSKAEGPLIEVKLIDDSWNTVNDGEYGEMAVRGPTVFSGYIGNPEANESDFHNGWFRTGDMFERNEDGTYDFIDRRKYLIKSGGMNIYPAELERVLLEHPDLKEAVAIRVPDEKWGEVPQVYASKADDAELSPDSLLEYMEDEIASYKLPHYVEFVDQDDFPRSTTGKIVRSELEAWDDTGDRVRNP